MFNNYKMQNTNLKIIFIKIALNIYRQELQFFQNFLQKKNSSIKIKYKLKKFFLFMNK
jgi:hypothetical protein